MKVRMAIYSLYGSGEYPKLCERVENDKDYTRLTEPQEVTFIERDHTEIVLEQVDALKKKKKEIQAEMATRIAVVDDEIQKLMAIEYSATDEG